MCVICAYPVGVTWHSPNSSPSAASNPAETIYWINILCFVWDEYQLTNDEVWGEFERYGHYHLLECMKIICITHTTLRPWYIYRTQIFYKLIWFDERKYLLAQPRSLAARHKATIWPTRIKCTLIISMYGHIQNARIVPKCPLRPIPFWRR